jgi:hypothetical protein
MFDILCSSSFQPSTTIKHFNIIARMDSAIIEQAIRTPLPDAADAVPPSTAVTQRALADDLEDIFFDVTEGRLGLDATVFTEAQRKALYKATKRFFNESPQGKAYNDSLKPRKPITNWKIIHPDSQYIRNMLKNQACLGYLEEMVEEAKQVAKGVSPPANILFGRP